MQSSEPRGCEYLVRYGHVDERPCGKFAVYELEITIDDAVEAPESKHFYCRTHGHQADTNVLLAAASAGRLGEVHHNLRRI